MLIEIYRRIQMTPQNRSRCHRTNLSLEACFHRLCFALVWNYSKNFLRFENLFRRHRYRLLRYLRDIRKPRFADLLLPARLIQADDDVRLLRIEIGRRIVKGNVPVFPNAEESNVNWSRRNLLAQLAHHGGGVGSIPRKQVIIADSGLSDQ